MASVAHTADDLLAMFKNLPTAEQQKFVVGVSELIKPKDEAPPDEVWEGEISELTDEDLSQVADETFRMYDLEEQSHGDA